MRHGALLLPIICAWSIVIPGAAGEMRDWQSMDGKYRVRAELKNIEGETVVLKREDGHEVQVPLEKLSEADRRYVAADQNKQKAPVQPASSSSLSAAIEREAAGCQTAEEALLVYQTYLADGSITKDSEYVETRLAHWESAAAKGVARIGKEWLPASEAEVMRREGVNVLKQAVEVLKVNIGMPAVTSLQEASRADRSSGASECLMGLVYALEARDFESAKDRFTEAMRRDSGDPCALNNLALVESFLGDHVSAQRHFQGAVARGAHIPELRNNLQRILQLEGKGKLVIPASTARSYAKTYTTVVKEQLGPAQEPNCWMYLTPFVGGGTGFIVFPKFVLTSGIAAREATEFVVSNPLYAGRGNLEATLVAKSEGGDLAILYCQQLEAPPVVLCCELPSPGSEVKLFGHPECTVTGDSLKSMPGRILGLPNPAVRERCLYEVKANPGNTGGPLCDDGGQVVALHYVGYNLAKPRSLAVPTVQMIDFVTKEIPVRQLAADIVQSAAQLVPFCSTMLGDLQWMKSRSRKIDPKLVEARLRASTVLVLRKEPPIELIEVVSKTHSNSIEDRGCITCRASGKARCKNPECKGGFTIGVRSVVKGYEYHLDGSPPTKKWQDEKYKIDCLDCEQGFVQCDECGGTGRQD